MLGNLDLLVKVEHVENDNLKVYLQKIGLKEKVKQVEEQELGSKVNLKKNKEQGESKTCRKRINIKNTN
jgi:hypothetical protein